MINKVELTEVKGTNKSFELKGCDLLTGSFGSGKSTIIQGIRYCIDGKAADKDGNTVSKNEDVFKMASASAMSVTLETDDGTYTRGLEKKTKGYGAECKVSFSTFANISNKFGEKTTSEMAARIKSDFGMDEQVLNFSEFTKLSANEQRKFIFGIYSPNEDDWTEEKVIDRLKYHTNYSENESIQAELDNTYADVLSGYKNPQEGIKKGIDTAKEKFSEYDALKKRDEVTIQELHKIRNESGDTNAGLKVLEKKLELLQSSNTEHVITIKTYEVNKSKHAENDRKISELVKKIELERAELGKLSTERIEEEIAERTRMIGHKTDSHDKLAKIQRSIEELEMQRLALKIETEKLNEEEMKLSREKETLSSVIAEKKKEKALSQKEYEINLENINKINSSGGKCPLAPMVICNTDMGSYAETLQETEKRLAQEINHLQEAIDILSISEQDIMDKIGDCVMRNISITSEKALLNKQIEELRISYSEIKAKEQKEQEDNEKVISNLETKLKVTEANRESLSRSIKMNQDRFEELKAEILIMPEIDIDQVESDKAMIETRIREVKAEIEEKQKIKINYENLAKREEEAQSNIKMWQAWKLTKEAIGAKGVLGDMLSSSLSPLIDGVNQNLRAFGIEKQFYVSMDSESGSAAFEFGWMHENKKHSYETLSRGETLILATAIIIEFMQKTCRKKILMIDDVNHINFSDSIRFIEGVVRLRDKYDNAILAANFEESFDIEGLNVIKMG